MDKKVRILPSARTKFIKDENMKLIYRILLVLAALMVVQNVYLYGLMYGVKLALMVIVSIIVAKETEILFYTHNQEIDRASAKELIKKSYSEVLTMIYVLMIPIGTPLWLVALGAVLATFIGKLLLGGFHHMVFHSSLVGVILLTIGWTQIVKGVAFATAFDNYLIELAFNHPFFTQTLGLGGIYDPSNMSTALQLFYSGSSYPLGELFFGLNPGVVGSAFVLLLIFVFLIYKKAIQWIVPITAIASFLVTAFIVGLINNYDSTFALYYLFSGSFLFVAVFVMSDSITIPMPFWGKIIFGVVVGALTVIIRLAQVYEEGVVFAVLFMNMLTPLLNEVLKKKPQVKKAVEANG